MWIEWDDQLFNLDQVKRIYIRDNCGPGWCLEIVFSDLDKYISFFDNKKEAEIEYEKFKEKAVRSFVFIRSIPY